MLRNLKTYLDYKKAKQVRTSNSRLFVVFKN